MDTPQALPRAGCTSSVTLPSTDTPHSLWGTQHLRLLHPRQSPWGQGVEIPSPFGSPAAGPQGAGPPAVAHWDVEEGPHHPRVAREPRDPLRTWPAAQAQQDSCPSPTQRQVHMGTAHSPGHPKGPPAASGGVLVLRWSIGRGPREAWGGTSPVAPYLGLRPPGGRWYSPWVQLPSVVLLGPPEPTKTGASGAWTPQA